MVWESGALRMLDQRLLPLEEQWLELRTWQEVAEAIRDMAVRGAPAIGVAAAYGLALAARQGEFEAACKGLAASRPTAVNLFWAIDRLQRLPDHSFGSCLAEAQSVEREDLEMNLAIGEHGASLVPLGAHIVTICNTGALATAGHGTALGIIRTAYASGKGVFVSTLETRPRQQGLRLTAWELLREGIPFQSIADGAAGGLLASGDVSLAIAGADRIAANGDTANKVGTLMLAVLCKHFGVPFYVAAPSSTFDLRLPDGSGIPIETRGAEELTEVNGVRVAPHGCPVYNPAFDVTPGELITAFVTESGVHRPPYYFQPC